MLGNWTENVSTKVNNFYISLPVVAVYKFYKPWEISGGFFIPYVADKAFSGYVPEGYLRKGDPIGNKIIFEVNSRASY